MINNHSGFACRVAFATGGASGIGAEICRRLAAQGAHIAVADQNATGAAAVAEEIVALGGSATGQQRDVTDPRSVQTGVAETVRAFGGLNLCANNAGMVTPRGSGGDTDNQAARRAATIQCTQPTGPQLVA